jgi:hypothetical protein
MANARDDTTLMLRQSLRNQRVIMKALIVMMPGGIMGGVASADELRDRVREMEQNLEWICPPSQRIA